MDASVEPAMVGLTEYAVSQLGELVFVDLPSPVYVWRPATRSWNSNRRRPSNRGGGGGGGVPVAGTVRYVNREASDDPGIITNDPYGEAGF